MSKSASVECTGCELSWRYSTSSPKGCITHMHSLSVLLVHFIDKDETWYSVLVGLPPHGHALGLCTEQTRLGSVSARDGN